MKINEVIGEWIIMPQTIKPMGLIKKPGGGFDFKNKGNNRANEKAPPGREKQVKALKGKVDNPYAVAWASYNKGKDKTNEAPIEQDHNNPIAKPYVDMPEWKALHDMDDKIIDAYIKHKEVKEADEFAPARALGEAEHMLEYSYKMAIAHLEGKHDEANIKAGVIKERIPALLEKIKKLYKNEDAAGVGIITKQNTTQDVKPGETQRQAKKLHLR
jgi:hypothetical protein